jgi:hypothetical protein
LHSPARLIDRECPEYFFNDVGVELTIEVHVSGFIPQRFDNIAPKF